MKNSFLKFVFAIIIILSPKLTLAQNGATGTRGMDISYNMYVNGAEMSAGDANITKTGYLEIGPKGIYEIIGATINDGVIEVNNGGQLSIYGDVTNRGKIILHDGGSILYYGQTWTNSSTASIEDGAGVNTIPGGDLRFTAAANLVTPSWLTACVGAIAYNGGEKIQYLDGANVPMDVVMHVQNPSSIILTNTPTRIEGELQWNVASGNISLGNNDLIFNKNASEVGFQADRFAITNGNGHVVKENYTGDWIFPVGKTTGDYTPAAINNTVMNTMHVLVQDYATSAAVESVTGTSKDGMQRTWNIYADNAAGNSIVNLQHNIVTNQPEFAEDNQFVTQWSTTTPNTSGDLTYSTTAWQSNNPAMGITGNLSSTGTVSGSSMRSRSYSNFATNANDAIAYFTKSTKAFNVLPSNLLSFTASKDDSCEVTLRFTSGIETEVDKYFIQYSTDGITFTNLTTISKEGSDHNYSYIHTTPINGKNYYRLAVLDLRHNYTMSAIEDVTINCGTPTATPIKLYPNPTTNIVNVTGYELGSKVFVLNELGRVMLSITPNTEIATLDLTEFPAAHYIVEVVKDNKKITAQKLLKQ
jgi:hypothetical protein